MLNKEIKDTLVLFAGSIGMVLFTMGFSFLMIRSLVDDTFPFADFAPLLIYVAMMGVSFYLGISLFAEEKSERSFEYLFSLRYSRGKILLYKILPRLAALLVIIGLYALLSSIIRPFPVPSGWLITILLYFSLFLSGATMSLLHRNHLTNLVYALGIYMLFYGIFAITIIQLRGLGNDVIFSIIRILMILVMVIALFIFSAFWYHFKKADLGNYTRLFGKSLFSGLKFIGIPILALVLIWIFINRFDAAEIEGEFKLANKPTVHYGRENGFYRLWTLSEAPRIDVDSDRVVMKYRHLFDPEFENEKYLQAWDHQAYREGYARYHRLRLSILKGGLLSLDWNPYNKDLAREIFNSRNRILRLKDEYTVFLERYEKLMACSLFEDITLPRHDSPIPNLLAWMHISKLHDWLSVLDAREGNWDRAVERLISHIDFTKRALKGTRVLFINLVAKGVMRYSLNCLASLMNLKQCPDQIYHTILNRIQPVSTGEVGSRMAMQADYISTADFIDRNLYYLNNNNVISRIAAALLFQKNRTKKYFFEPYHDIIELENQPPYLWKTGLDELREKYSASKKGFFSWVVNPYGKFIAEDIAIPNLLSVVHKTYHTRIIIDMIRISAELHLNHDPGKPIEEILKNLNSYKTMDPCSGKPYRWNPVKQVLYSLGVDRDDDGGAYSYNTYYNTDYILPIVLATGS